MSNWSVSHLSSRRNSSTGRVATFHPSFASVASLSALDSSAAGGGGRRASSSRTTGTGTLRGAPRVSMSSASANAVQRQPQLMLKAEEERKLRNALEFGDTSVTVETLLSFVDELLQLAASLIVDGDFVAAEIAANRAELLSRSANVSRRKFSDEDWVVLALAGTAPSSQSSPQRIKNVVQRMDAQRARALSTIAFAAKSQGRYDDARSALIDSMGLQGEKPHLLCNLVSITSQIRSFAAVTETMAVASEVIHSVGAQLDGMISESNVEVLLHGSIEQRRQFADARRSAAQLLTTATLTLCSVSFDRLRHLSTSTTVPSMAAQRLYDRRSSLRGLEVAYIATRLVLELYEAQRLAVQELGADSDELAHCDELVSALCRWLSARKGVLRATRARSTVTDADVNVSDGDSEDDEMHNAAEQIDAAALDFDWRGHVRGARAFADRNGVLCDDSLPALQEVYCRSPFGVGAALLLGAALDRRRIQDASNAKLAAAESLRPPPDVSEDVSASARLLSSAVKHLTSFAPSPVQPPAQVAVPSPQDHDAPHGTRSVIASNSDAAAGVRQPAAGPVIAPPPLQRIMTREASPPPSFGGSARRASTQLQNTIHPSWSPLASAGGPASSSPSPQQQTPRRLSSGIVASPRPVERPRK